MEEFKAARERWPTAASSTPTSVSTGTKYVLSFDQMLRTRATLPSTAIYAYTRIRSIPVAKVNRRTQQDRVSSKLSVSLVHEKEYEV